MCVPDALCRRVRHGPPRGGSKRVFQLPSFLLAVAGIRRRLIQGKAIEKDDLIPLRAGAALCRRVGHGPSRGNLTSKTPTPKSRNSEYKEVFVSTQPRKSDYKEIFIRNNTQKLLIIDAQKVLTTQKVLISNAKVIVW